MLCCINKFITIATVKTLEQIYAHSMLFFLLIIASFLLRIEFREEIGKKKAKKLALNEQKKR